MNLKTATVSQLLEELTKRVELTKDFKVLLAQRRGKMMIDELKIICDPNNEAYKVSKTVEKEIQKIKSKK